MIKTDIVAYVSSYALEGELIVPSAVLTSTPQEQEINLTYTPNFQLKLMDKNSYVVDDAWMSFSYSDTNYTAYMNVVNRTQDGIVTLQYNNGLTSEEIPTPEPPEPEPTLPHFTSPVDGDTITGTIDAESGQFTYPVEIVGADGNNISYDITLANIDICTGGSPWSISHDEEDDGNGGTYISRVYMVCSNAGSGDERLTFVDPKTGDMCSTTFTYDISVEQPEYLPLDVIMMSGNENQWQSPSITDYIEVTDPNQDDPETGEPPLRVTGDCTFSCGDSNITINGTEITASAPGVYEIIAQDNNTGRVGSVIWTITEAQPEPQQSTILTSANIRTLNGDNETGDPCSYPDPESDNTTITIDENLEMSFDTSPSIICYNSPDGTDNYIKLEAGNFYFTALGNDIAQVIVTLNPSFNNDTSHLDVQPDENNQLIFDVNNRDFSLGVVSTPLYITQIEVIYGNNGAE